MPRTKKPTPKPKAPRLPDSEEAARKKQLDEIVEEQKQALDQRCEAEINNIQLAFRILVSSLSKDTLQKTIGQMKTELALRDRPPPSSGRRAVSQDDGYLTEGSQPDTALPRRRPSRSATRHVDISQASSADFRTGRRSRSTEVSSRRTTARPRTQHSAMKAPAARPPTSAYKTPAYNKNASCNFPPITPKVTPNMPLTVLRRPRQGEMVVSMSGSPLMVPTMQAEHKANCNIPLHDGTMLSLQPEAFRKSNTFVPISLMDKDVMRQVKTLQKNLETVVKLGEKNGLL